MYDRLNCEVTQVKFFHCGQKKEMLGKAIDIVKSFCGDLCEPGKGILFAIPLAFVDGLPEEV